MTNKKSNRELNKKILDFFLLTLITIVIIIIIIDPSSEPKNNVNETNQETLKPLEMPVDEFLEHQVIEVYGDETNSEKNTFISVNDVKEGIKSVSINANDNLTTNLMRKGMWMRAAEYYESIIEHNEVKALDEVSIVYYLTLVDQLGNEKESIVMIITMETITLEEINWENFDYNNFPSVALDYNEHPAISE